MGLIISKLACVGAEVKGEGAFSVFFIVFEVSDVFCAIFPLVLSKAICLITFILALIIGPTWPTLPPLAAELTIH